MPTIDPDKKRVTLINTFHVDSTGDQDLLIDSLQRATVEVMQHLPGYVAASVHRSLDSQRVLNYAQWESMEHFQSMLANPLVRPHLDEVKSITARLEPVLYEVAYVHEKHSTA
jgi:quinol monooxygenase YgiN